MAKSIVASAMPNERSTLEDHEVLARVAANDKAAFEELYRRYIHRVSRFVGKMIRDVQTAEEVVDDTLFAVWKSAARFQSRSSVSTWIFGIAYRQALKALERARKHMRVDVDTECLGALEDSEPGNNPESSAVAGSLHELVARGIDHLSDEHRTTVQLTAMGHSYQEIADITGCPANTVKTRMFYARQKLRDFLGQHNTTFDERPNQ